MTQKSWFSTSIKTFFGASQGLCRILYIKFMVAFLSNTISFLRLKRTCCSWWIIKWMFPKVVAIPPKSSILIGFSSINHPFWGTTIFGNTPNVFQGLFYPTQTMHYHKRKSLKIYHWFAVPRKIAMDFDLFKSPQMSNIQLPPVFLPLLSLLLQLSHHQLA